MRCRASQGPWRLGPQGSSSIATSRAADGWAAWERHTTRSLPSWSHSRTWPGQGQGSTSSSGQPATAVGENRPGRGPATAASHAGDGGARQSRRRSGCSSGTSTTQMRTPSGPRSTSPKAPTAPASAPAGSARHPRRAPAAPRPARAPAATTPRPALAARRRGPTAPGTRHPGRRPCPGPARCRTRGRSPAPACRGRTPGCAPGRSGAGARGCSTRPWRHDHPADPTGGAMAAPGRWSKRIRTVMQVAFSSDLRAFFRIRTRT
jgi:hypothetical protein